MNIWLRNHWGRWTKVCLVALAISLGCGCGGGEPAVQKPQNNPDSSPAPDASSSPNPEPTIAPGTHLLRPLQSADTASTGEALFTRLDAAGAGIDFVSRWAPADPLSQRLTSSFAGSGAAVGDVDNDGRPDIYLTRPHGGPALFRNLGGFRFEDVTERAGLSEPGLWCAGATFADVDNDGDLDLYVCVQKTTNKLYLNDGSGRFTESAGAGLEYQGNGLMASFADIDGDGDLDMFLLTNRGAVDPDSELGRQALREGTRIRVDERIADFYGVARVPGSGENAGPKVHLAGERDFLFENQGDGTFRDITAGSGIHGHDIGQNAVWWDYDRDGDPDLYVTNDFTGPDRLWHNDRRETGNATFRDVGPQTVPQMPWFGMGCDSADINNDGWPDLIASDMAASTHYKAKLTMGDMASVSWMLEFGEPRQAMRNTLLVNSGTGRFQETAQLAGVASTDWSWATLFDDFDGDGWQDLFVCNGMTRDWMNSDYSAGLDMKKWVPRQPLREKNFAFRNRGGEGGQAGRAFRFENVSAAWGLDDLGVSFSAARADFDGDGDPDLLVNNFDGPAWLYRNNRATPNLAIRLRGTDGNRRGIGATVVVETTAGTQSKELHCVRGFLSCSDDTLLFGLGSVTSATVRVEWPSGRRQTVDAVPAGHELTLREPAAAAPAPPAPPAEPPPLFAPTRELAASAHMEIPYDDFARQPLLPNRVSALGPGIAVGDIDGDGDDDLYAGGASGQAPRLFENRDGVLQRKVDSALVSHASVEEMGVLLFDANGDGRSDLYMGSGGVETGPELPQLRDRLLLRGDAPWQAAELPDVRLSTGPIAAADVDRDGDLDLFTGGRSVPGEYPAPALSVLLRNEASGFIPNGLADSEGLATAAVWSDTDNDGWLDLHVAYEWGSVRRWRNVEGQLEPAPMPELPGWWSSLLAVDVDHDGDMDLAAGNTGLNTKYHADPTHPVKIYHGSFKADEPKRIVESCVEDGVEFPIRGRSCSTRAMPFLGEAFPNFELFAKATLPDIYGGALQQNETDTYQVTELRSGVFINNGSGGFTFQPFPDAAQVSPVFGMVAFDATGDGSVDLLCAQNFFGPQPETGRFNGGLGVLLAGAGNGAFAAVPAHRSGIVWPGDATALVLGDFDADRRPDAVLAYNDGPLLHTELERELLPVRLLGPPGNPTAIGARLIAQRPGGSCTTEISAGSGYLSQSAPLAWFPSDTTRVDIRWPDGSSTNAIVDAAATAGLVIQHPANVAATPVPMKTATADPNLRAYAVYQAQTGTRFEQQSFMQKAARRYEESLRYLPANLEARFGLARLAYKAGDSAAAMRHLDAALAAEAGHPLRPAVEQWQSRIADELKAP